MDLSQSARSEDLAGRLAASWRGASIRTSTASVRASDWGHGA
jgi:hypothetical protein